ncbi:MAG: dipeptidase PepV [Firmicutes bacterium]|nr:dipeptidase PepV [Bacillota bacterium]
MEDLRQKVKEKVWSYKEDMIKDIFELVAIESVQTEAKPGMPFGEGPALALDKSLEIAQRLGFEAVNLDNYVVYTHSGQGKERIGVLGHVDVVPLGEGWTKKPLGGDRDEEFIYGRGVSDNKGPCIMSLYALKIIKELGIELNKEVRILMGANEESGMQCVRYYREKEGGFDYAFSPDASFPVTFGEKGGFSARFSASKVGPGPVKLIHIKGGTAGNVVCPKVDVVLEAEQQEHDEVLEKFTAYLAANDLKGQSIIKENEIQLQLEGVAAHASTPEQGVNAISHMMGFLQTIMPHVPFVAGYNQCIGLAYNGENCGVDLHDEYGRLTFNVGVINTEEDLITANIDIRYPVTIEDFSPHRDTLLANLEKCGFEVKNVRMGKPLFVPPESPLIKTLSAVYEEITGDTENKPTTMGGGTYAKNFDNCVAFGATFVGENNNIHNVDERQNIENILRATEIITHAIIRLLSL